MAILLNNDELYLMRGLPHAAFCLYVAIRQTMDMATGMCGIRSLISWQGLAESLYVEPEQGRVNSGSLSRFSLMRLGALLERAGLIKNCSNSKQRHLIFKCLIASHDKSAQNKPAPHPAPSNDTTNAVTARVVAFPKNKPAPHPALHPSLVLYSIDKSSSSEQAIEGNPISDDDDKNSDLQNQKPLTFPPRTEDWQREQMRAALKDIPRHDAQRILDELAGRIRAGKVERPVGYFGKILENYLRGDFIGELADGEKRIREQRETEQEARRNEQAKPAYQRNDAAFAETRAKLIDLGILKRKKPHELST